MWLALRVSSCSIDCKVINLAHNTLSALPHLQEQSEIEELDVSKNEICVIGSNHLKHVKSLKTLRLSENLIGEERREFLSRNERKF
jgi:hypothetical protein